MPGGRHGRTRAKTGGRESRWRSIVEAAADLEDRLDESLLGPRLRAVNAKASAAESAWSRIVALDPQLWQGWVKSRGLTVGKAGVCLKSVGSLNSTALPAWVARVRHLVLDLEQSLNQRKRGTGRARTLDHPLFFAPLCLPILHGCRHRLSNKLPAQVSRLLSARAHRRFRAQLVVRLLNAITPAAQKQLESFLASKDEVSGDTPCRGFLRPSGGSRLLKLLVEFPILARVLSEIGHDWELGTREFLHRLYRDRRRLRPVLGYGVAFKGRSLMVTDVRLGLSDPHGGGRCVAAIRFASGRWIIYKPRSCAGEWMWGGLLRSLKSTGLRLRVPKVVRRPRWGWMEFVPSKPCRVTTAASLFYRRAGVLLCLAHLVRAVDFHRGNFIANASQPIIIDCETLWHPDISLLTNPALVGISCLARTGMIPAESVEKDSPGAWHALDSCAVPADDKPPHRPRAGRMYLAASDFVDALAEGFQVAAWALLGTANRRKAFEKRLADISAAPWRRIRRPTAHYMALSAAALDPRLLGDGCARFFFLLEASASGGTSPPIAWAEAQALSRCDIPYLSGVENEPFARNFAHSKIGHYLPSLQEVLNCVPELRRAFPRSLF